MQPISLSYPSWYIILCLALGLIFAVGLYYRNKSFREQSSRLNPILGVLRFLTGSLISFLLLSPLIKSIETSIEKPTIVIAQDISESVGLSMDETDQAAYQEQMEALTQALGTNYQVATYSFGDQLRDSLRFGFSDKVTNISEALSGIYDQYSHQNLGAIILASDGIYNEGSNPNYIGSKLAVPIYTIAIGDTTPARDLLIRQVLSNKIAYMGDKMEVQIDISAKNLQGQSSKVVVYEVEGGQSRKLEERAIPIGKNDFFTTSSFVLEMNKSGVRQYRFALAPLQGEVSKVNNSRDVYIEVLDARQKILILADAPHPDLSAIKQSLQTNKNYQVSIDYIAQYQGPIAENDLVVLHQLPSISNNAKSIIQSLNQHNIPRLFILGAKSDIRNASEMQGLVNMTATGDKTNLVQGAFANDFALFSISEQTKQVIPQFNPMIAPFGKFSASANARVLLYQKIGKITTEYPLWVLGEANGIKTGIITAEGIWKWRLFDYLQHQDHRVADELITKTVQFLSVKEDKRRFRVNIQKNVFKENEPIFLNSELYNENYELVNEPDVSLNIIDQSGKEFPFTFNRNGKSYSLNAGFFPTGQYRFKGQTAYAGKQFDASGKFTVKDIQLEKYALTANHNLLQLLSNSYNGKMVYPNQIASLTDIITQQKSVKPVLYQTVKNKPLIHFKWILGLIILLLTIEWFLRKYFGGT